MRCGWLCLACRRRRQLARAGQGVLADDRVLDEEPKRKVYIFFMVDIGCKPWCPMSIGAVARAKRGRSTMRNSCLGAAFAAIVAVIGTPVWAATCVNGSVSTYTASGFSCSVGGVTFSDISVNVVTTGSGSVALGSFTPFDIIVNGAEEFGLYLNYDATTGGTADSKADVAWTYNVAGSLLGDAYMTFTGSSTGTGTATLSETLSNGVSLSLTSPGSTSATFSPIASLGVIKDQNDFSGSAGSAETSIVGNGFSLVTPLPASLPLFGTGLVGLWGLRKRQKKKQRRLVSGFAV
jgi:hypothetical protein